MSGMVSLRINGLKAGEKVGSGGGQRAHDSRTGIVPNYVDSARSSQNRILLGSMNSETLMQSQQEQTLKMGENPKKNHQGYFGVGHILKTDLRREGVYIGIYH